MMKRLTAHLSLAIVTVLLAAPLTAKVYHYISIDAGGSLGLIPAQLLNDLEEKTHRPIYQLVDGMIGTSTGSIISSLLSVPSSSEKPYSAAQVVDLYKNQSHSIFETVLNSYILNSFRKFFDMAPNYDDANEKYEIYATRLWQNLGISHAYTNLLILCRDADSLEPFVFSSEESNHYNLFIRQVVKASVSIADVFGATELKFITGETKRFIDTATTDTGKPIITDPTAFLYHQIKSKLKPSDLAVIYSLGTGYAPTSDETRELMNIQNRNKPNNISIIRIQPEVEELAGGPHDSLWMSILASDTSPETIYGMTQEAIRLMQSPEYRQMLANLKLVPREDRKL